MEDSSRQMEDMSMRRLNGNIESSIPVVVKQEDESKKTRTRRYSHLKPDRRDTYVVKLKLDKDARKPKCGRCGFVHQQGRCPAFGKNCNKCGKKNRFSAVCHSENKKFSKQMTRHRKRDRTNKNTTEICEDRSDESDSYGDDGSDSEVEYGLFSHKIDLLSLSRQSFKTELSEAEHDEIFEYDAEDEYEEPYHDIVSFRDSENDQSFTFGDRSVLGDILEAPGPPPMQFRYEALEISVPPLPDLCCSETEESDLDCNDEPYESQNEDLVICPPPGFVNKTPGSVNEAPQNEYLVICPPPGFVNEAPQNEDLVICPPPGFVNEAPQNEDLVICPPPGFVNETPGFVNEAPQNEYLVIICPPPGFVNEAPQNEDLVICPPPGFVNEAPQNEDLVICPPPGFVNETPGFVNEAPQNEYLVIICPPPGFVNEAPQNEDLIICPPPGFVNETPI